MSFKIIKKAVQEQVARMMENSSLFYTDTDIDEIWNIYLKSFPEGSNPVFRERTEHDCSCCKQFIRQFGNVVSIKNGKLQTIWDIDVGGHYQVVADAMSEYVKSCTIYNIFLSPEKKIGTDYNRELMDGSVHRWDHFYVELSNSHVKRKDTIGGLLSESRSNFDVLYRSLKEITIDSADMVIELIDQNSIYRGEEFRSTINLFLDIKREFDQDEEQELFCWKKSASIGQASKIRNTVIGTLLSDISDGIELDKAVKKFESKVAPENYKRPKALITKSMIKAAQEKVFDLGLTDSLPRRYANTSDLSINNVIFADRSVQPEMDIFDEMASEVPEKIEKFNHVEEVNIKQFMSKILPKAGQVELMLENRHERNMMSIIAPVKDDAPQLFKWGNMFSWGYNGNVADSMRERVRNAGGKVDGILRFSIMWNEEGDNQNDFDAHCKEPNGNLISFLKKGRIQPSTGMLDVDIIDPGSKPAVENITWTDKSMMQEGRYQFIVHNYSHRGGRSGFKAEIEYEGNIYSYVYDKELKNNEKVAVAVIYFSRKNGVNFIDSLPSTLATRELWNISTNKFHKAKMVLHSPNHWDGEKTGNKHFFFILEGCLNPGSTRGFYNEFLREDLRESRKVFEVLGSKMKAEWTENQLSGVGFSSTQRNSVFCRITGKTKRVVKIIF